MTGWATWIAEALGSGRYRPSAYALTSDPIMVMLFVSGWFAAGVACISIGFALAWRRREHHVTLSAKAARLYGALFMLIGLDFLLSMTTVFLAVYRLKVVVLGLTAAVTVNAAILTISRIFGSTRDDERL